MRKLTLRETEQLCSDAAGPQPALVLNDRFPLPNRGGYSWLQATLSSLRLLLQFSLEPFSLKYGPRPFA